MSKWSGEGAGISTKKSSTVGGVRFWANRKKVASPRVWTWRGVHEGRSKGRETLGGKSLSERKKQVSVRERGYFTDGGRWRN